MPQPQNNITIAAPGFKGLNTQDSPIAMDMSYAAIANNCVIDKLGRVAARKGFVQYTQNPETLTGPIETVHEFVAQDGVVYVFACGDNTIFSQTLGGARDLVPVVLPPAYTVTGSNWQMVSFNDKVYFVQAGHEPLLFDPNNVANGSAPYTLETWEFTPPLGADWPNTATAAFGHLWTGDFDSGVPRVYWSDLLDGDGYGNTSGYFNLEQFWPSGYDRVVAIRAHNDFLLVFGERNIVVYNIPITGVVDSSLVDTVEGIGCISRDSIQPTGTDFLFVDHSGVRSFGRTIQEKSMPIGDVSLNVMDDIKRDIAAENNKNIRSVYDPEDSFYAVFLPDVTRTYVFDTRFPLENGAFRPTIWPNLPIRCSAQAENRETWYGGTGGLYQYTGYTEVRLDPDADPPYTLTSSPISMSYWTHPQTWGDPVRLKILKQLDATFIGSEELEVFIRWGFDYEEATNQVVFNRVGGKVYQYNIDKYGEAEYSGASTLLTTEQFNIWGNGRNVRFGFDATLIGTQLSLQEINIQALMGRMM